MRVSASHSDSDWSAEKATNISSKGGSRNHYVRSTNKTLQWIGFGIVLVPVAFTLVHTGQAILNPWRAPYAAALVVTKMAQSNLEHDSERAW
ncbi:MAG: hypothetical protein CMP47_07840 [Rickettsiales bacterium]|nr:hypothetical protein [Rickettsiales bacterium]